MSDDASDSSSRLDRLETLMAHQERTISELNDVIAAQWRKIDALERQLLRLREDMQNIDRARDAPEPPPPHY
ncbi:SlyX family protein [Methylocystis sp. IM3]|jgi:SlyX protein|uniref:SlyX family protein n=1 Tax=unclassified Methylocystis TaxID=2625913 RepID=UPI000FBBB164|nr:MAG: SlyX family protein [Hyphomicrobiales bacterium]